MVKIGISAALAAALLAVAPATQAQDLGDIVKGIARATLEQQEAQQEQAYWNAMVQQNTASSYRNYLDRYPRGSYVNSARQRLNAIQEGTNLQQQNNSGTRPVGGNANAGSSAANSEASLSRSDRIAIQARLSDRGYYRGGLDGAFGQGTRNAIAQWQSASGFSATGYLTRAQAQTLLSGASGQSSNQTSTGGTTGVQGELAAQLSREQRTQAQRDLNTLGFNAGSPDGLFGSGTRNAIRGWQQSKGLSQTGYLTSATVRTLHEDAVGRGSSSSNSASDPAADEERLLGLGRSERVEVQKKLVALGYDTQETAGTFGYGTRQAMKKWQGDNGFRATGYLDADQYRQIRSQRR
ncbi:MAG: hypothetical protein DI498_00495 [Paracoccus denitrificans]|nr:MAG: hypothetical protein DI498_00495 [Paracoccus denitrificans]PZO86248.1 MAG: hypothetical protein DI633_00495 [Paracoccus denitrificans]